MVFTTDIVPLPSNDSKIDFIIDQVSIIMKYIFTKTRKFKRLDIRATLTNHLKREKSCYIDETDMSKRVRGSSHLA